MLTAFTAGLVLITISELGDKTFFIALILATRHPRRWVFAGATVALAAMTIISVLLGGVVALLPRSYTHYLAIVLFLILGLKLLYTARQMRCAPLSSGTADCGGELCDGQQEALVAVKQAESRLASQAPFAIVLEAFTLTFLAEWGDRTQFATITLAAAQNPIGVTLGAIAGHTLCAAIAVLGGRLVAGRLSERWLTAIGGFLFLIFALVTWVEGI